MIFTLQVLGLLITYFLLVVQFANPSAESPLSDATNSTVASGGWNRRDVVYVTQQNHSCKNLAAL